MDKYIDFLLLPPRGFDPQSLYAVSRRICPQDHGAPHKYIELYFTMDDRITHCMVPGIQMLYIFRNVLYCGVKKRKKIFTTIAEKWFATKTNPEPENHCSRNQVKIKRSRSPIHKTYLNHCSKNQVMIKGG